MTRRNIVKQTRPAGISNFVRHFTAVEISGNPIANLLGFMKEGDLEHLNVPSCIPRAVRLKQLCISLKYFSSTGAGTPTALFRMAKSSDCIDPVVFSGPTVVDVTDVMTNQAFVLNCFCAETNQIWDVCDQFTVDLQFPDGGNQPQSLLTRIVLDWELL